MTISKWLSLKNIARTIFTIALTAGISWAFHYYFYKALHPDSSKAVYKGIADFYANFSLDNRDITQENIQHMARGNSDAPALQKMAIEAAFMRYRLDPAPGGLFEKYIATFQQGRWNVPPLSVWRSEFDGIAGPWDSHQAQHIQTRDAGPQPNITLSKSSILLEYTTATTSMIGRSLVLDIELASPDILPQLLDFIISYGDDNNPQIQNCNWSASVSNAGEKYQAQLSLDFFTILSWCQNPNRVVRRIVISGADFTGCKINAVHCN